MIRIKGVKIEWDGKRVLRAERVAHIKWLFKVGGMLREIARRSIRRRKSNIASPPGTPPHTHTGALKNSIVFQVDRATDSVVIGPRAEVMDQAASVHEFGLEYYGRKYPARPFMGPAQEKAEPKLDDLWEQSISETRM